MENCAGVEVSEHSAPGETPMIQKKLSKADLEQFTGTEQWYRQSLNRRVV